MKIFVFTILFFCVLGLAGFVYMAQKDLNVPERQVEQVIDNERFFNTATN